MTTASKTALSALLQLGDEAMASIADRVAEILGQRLAAFEQRRPSPYMTVLEAAEFLRCDRQRIDDLLSQRKLSRVKDGRRTLLSRAEIERYLESGMRPALLHVVSDRLARLMQETRSPR